MLFSIKPRFTSALLILATATFNLAHADDPQDLLSAAPKADLETFLVNSVLIDYLLQEELPSRLGSLSELWGELVSRAFTTPQSVAFLEEFELGDGSKLSDKLIAFIEKKGEMVRTLKPGFEEAGLSSGMSFTDQLARFASLREHASRDDTATIKSSIDSVKAAFFMRGRPKVFDEVVAWASQTAANLQKR